MAVCRNGEINQLSINNQSTQNTVHGGPGRKTPGNTRGGSEVTMRWRQSDTSSDVAASGNAVTGPLGAGGFSSSRVTNDDVILSLDDVKWISAYKNQNSGTGISVILLLYITGHWIEG